jgi:hypothetical protein
MDMVCYCSKGKFKCGVHEVDAVSVIAIHYKHFITYYTCEEVEEIGFSGKIYIVRVKKEPDGKVIKILEVYV